MAYKMKGYSYPGKSPLKQKEETLTWPPSEEDMKRYKERNRQEDLKRLAAEKEKNKEKIKDIKYVNPSPAKQKPKKSTESAHGQLGDAEREYEQDKGKYWYKVNGKRVPKHVYNKYENKPGGDEIGKQTNDPDASGNKAKIARDRASNTKINKK